MGKRVGAYLHARRTEQGYSIRRLGKQLGISPAFISLIERGRRETSISVLYTLTHKLGGNFTEALFLLALDSGVPEEALGISLHSDTHPPS